MNMTLSQQYEYTKKITFEAFTTVPRFIWRELVLSYEFMRYDLTATILPATLLLMAVSFAFADASEWIFLLAKSVVYFWLYIYIFNLSNQYVGYQEDVINKPTRPLPTGMVNKTGVRIRWYIFSIGFLLLGLVLNVAEWSLLWLAVVVLHNWLYLSWNWLGKNVLMGFGTLAQLAAAWQIVSPLDTMGWRWVITMSILIFLVVAVQDLRDLEGDKKAGRRTMPMVIGESLSRIYFALILLAIPIVIYVLLIAGVMMSPILLIHFSIMAMMCIIMAKRLIFQRSVHEDRVTYDWLTSWYMVVLSLTFWTL